MSYQEQNDLIGFIIEEYLLEVKMLKSADKEYGMTQEEIDEETTWLLKRINTLREIKEDLWILQDLRNS